MSKRSRKNITDLGELLGDGTSQPTAFSDPNSMEVINREVYGDFGGMDAIRSADANRIKAEPVDIFAITPDRSQPRRTVPYIVRQRADWDYDVDRMQELFLTWEALVNEARGNKSFRLETYLEQREIGDRSIDFDGDKADRPGEISPIEESLVSLIELATNIAEHGLTNPITVVEHKFQTEYELETGERRWLAYHLLYIFYAGTDEQSRFSKIPARTVTERNLWRQAAENNARQNLNAISRARQFAVLLMDLLQERGTAFKPFHQFEYERNYYAQVSEGDEYRIPRGTSERLINAMGVKNARQLRDYRALLRLPREVWEWADDYNWPERAIREMQELANDDDDLVQLAQRKLRGEDDSVPMGTVTEEKIKKKKDKNI
ncbi:MAG: ParB N-terminal domain-containing protein, partial [Anaerolineae bacterium]|nr:ParB N-terminal domain-containing protein [Anaerolineae bacterium]